MSGKLNATNAHKAESLALMVMQRSWSQEQRKTALSFWESCGRLHWGKATPRTVWPRPSSAKCAASPKAGLGPQPAGSESKPDASIHLQTTSVRQLWPQTTQTRKTEPSLSSDTSQSEPVTQPIGNLCLFLCKTMIARTNCQGVPWRNIRYA